MDEFIDMHQEEIMEGLNDLYPELFPNDDVYLDDINEDYIYEYVKNNMTEEYHKYINPPTLDDKCREIIANQLIHDKKNNCSLYYASYKEHKLTKAKFLEAVYKVVDNIIYVSSVEELIDMLKKQPYYNFDAKKQFDNSNSKDALALITPVVIKRVDADGNTHLIIDFKVKEDDTIVHTLQFDPSKLRALFKLLSDAGYTSRGFNWLEKDKHTPVILVYGKTEEAVTDLCRELGKIYKINLRNIEEGGR
jgi:hypothetical protein